MVANGNYRAQFVFSNVFLIYFCSIMKEGLNQKDVDITNDYHEL